MLGGRTSSRSRWADLIAAVILAAGALGLLTATLDDYGMAWDEGFTVEREERLREWFSRVGGESSPLGWAWTPWLSKLDRRATYLREAGSSASSPWSRASLRFYWQFAREEPNGHPPFYALLGLAGWAATHRALPPLESYRIGPAALFSITVGVIYAVIARRQGRAAGLLAAVGLLTMPRVFAHAHLASYDVPILCLWFMAVASFLKATEAGSTRGGHWSPSWGWTIAFGAAWGCAAATKLTGWFLPVPLLAWTIFHRDRRGVVALAVGGLVASVLIYALIPTWWADPIGGLRAFFRSNLTREQLKPIPTVFLGELYLFSLPWYNTLLWTAIATPPATLALAIVGMGRVVAGRFRDRSGTLWLACWAFFMILRALPNAPGHDGVRQFLAGFAFLACLAGIGLEAIGAGLDRVASPKSARALRIAILGLTLAAGGWSTWRHHPLQLSYYNALIGGLSGATKAGMEPTYYWEAVTPDVRDWLNENTPEGRKVAFCFPAIAFEYLHHWGQLRPSHLTTLAQAPAWYVVLNRPGHLLYPKESVGQFLLDHAEPVFVKASAAAPDVPLIAIFRGEDAYAAALILKRPTGEIEPSP